MFWAWLGIHISQHFEIGPVVFLSWQPQLQGLRGNVLWGSSNSKLRPLKVILLLTGKGYYSQCLTISHKQLRLSSVTSFLLPEKRVAL